jgi:hypothetical protein
VRSRKNYNKFLTTGQVAKILGISCRKVSLLHDQKVLPGFRIPDRRGSSESGDRRFSKEVVLTFMKRYEIPLDGTGDMFGSTILFVTQDDLLADRLKRLLPTMDGFTHLRVESAVEAGIKTAELHPFAVLVDMSCGIMEGSEIARATGAVNGCQVYAIFPEDKPAENASGLFRKAFGKPVDMKEVAKAILAQGE